MLYLVPVFFIIALGYSIAGFGGGSSYIAVLALSSVPYEVMPIIALACNIIVVSGGSYHFIRAGHFSRTLTLPFVITSIPAAYIAGSILLGRTIFMAVLATALLLAGLRMVVTLKSRGIRAEDLEARKLWIWGMPIGTALGGLAGLVGIGGGIFLAPVLSVIGWGTSKQIAATASVFILANSLAGLAGQLSKHGDMSFLMDCVWLFPAVLIGGQVGSLLGSRKLPYPAVRGATVVLVFVASANLYRKVLQALAILG